jgi:AmpD protein
MPRTAEGWLRSARRVRSPNFDRRPAGTEINLLVLHAISLPRGRYVGDAIERLFTNRLDAVAQPALAGLARLRVSSHFLVRRDGALLQFVPIGARAWHAGASQWRGRGRCNDFSVGIELEGVDDGEFTAAQYRCLATLICDLQQRLPLREIAAHSDVAPGRKSDPGRGFDWRRCAAGLAALRD